MQNIFPPHTGDFWKDEDLDDFVWMLKLIADEILIPPRPCFIETDNEKLACCTGVWHVCFACGKEFSRFCKLLQHKRDVHESAKFSCVCVR